MGTESEVANKSVKKVTTKVCPKCGGTNMHLLPTCDEKRCITCGHVITWIKEKGEPNYGDY